MSDPALLEQIMVAAGMGLLGAVVFAAIGLVSGTDETTTLAPLTLLVVLLGVPPAGVFTFFLAGAVAKHMTHAVPTALTKPMMTKNPEPMTARRIPISRTLAARSRKRCSSSFVRPNSLTSSAPPILRVSFMWAFICAFISMP